MRQRGAAEPELPINRWRELVPSSRDRKCYDGEKEEGGWVALLVQSQQNICGCPTTAPVNSCLADVCVSLG